MNDRLIHFRTLSGEPGAVFASELRGFRVMDGHGKTPPHVQFDQLTGFDGQGRVHPSALPPANRTLTSWVEDLRDALGGVA